MKKVTAYYNGMTDISKAVVGLSSVIEQVFRIIFAMLLIRNVTGLYKK